MNAMVLVEPVVVVADLLVAVGSVIVVDCVVTVGLVSSADFVVAITSVVIAVVKPVVVAVATLLDVMAVPSASLIVGDCKGRVVVVG